MGINATTDNISMTVHNAWKQALNRRMWYPQMMSLLNVYTNHLSGMFSGITDYAATQLLFAGCQKLPFDVSSFDVTAPFDYYTNLRLNNMPYSTFAIGQALSAGLNGFILQKTDLLQKSANTESWNIAMNLLNNIRFLQEHNLLNTAAVNGAQIASSSELSLWSALRAIDLLIVVGVNTDCNGYDVSKCKNGYVPHWECKDNMVQSVNITVPIDWKSNGDFEVSVVEIINGTETKPDFSYDLYQNQSFLVFSDVYLDSDETTRIFLVGAS